MSVRRRHLVAAAVIAATAIAVPTAALASDSTPPGKPAPSAAATKPAASPPAASKSAAASGAAAASKSAAASGAGALGSVTMSAEVAALATQLGISHHAAEQLLNQLAGQGGVDSTSHAFAAIAGDFHVSPARLAAALVAAKQSVANR